MHREEVMKMTVCIIRERGHEALARLLIEKGADVYKPDACRNEEHVTHELD